jgi:hypothetical protein
MIRIGNVELDGCVLNTVAEVGGVVGPGGCNDVEAVRLLTDYLTSGLVVRDEEQLNEMLFELYDWGEERSSTKFITGFHEDSSESVMVSGK